LGRAKGKKRAFTLLFWSRSILIQLVLDQEAKDRLQKVIEKEIIKKKF
jgi:hypothetical protein